MERILTFGRAQGLLPQDGLILCALSGGPDSVALLHFLKDRGFLVAAAHFDHHLRPTSGRDAAFVQELCRDWGVPVYLGGGDVAAMPGNTEENARRARYAFLERAAEELGAACVATAHNANDNLETVLLHLTRGCGLQGLCGIRPRLGKVVRPMLQTPRAAVEAYLRDRGLPYVTDETNADDSYARNRIRHQVVPVLEGLNPRVVEAAARMTGYLRADQERLGPREGPRTEETLPPLEFQTVAVPGVAETPLWTLETARRVCPEGPPTADAFYLRAVPELALRSRRSGDYLRPPFRTGKTVKKWMIERQVPRRQRAATPVLVSGERLLAVAGLGPDRDALAAAGEDAIFVRWTRRERGGA